MIYVPRNCDRGATVMDVAARQPIGWVMSIDTELGLVEVAVQPLRLSHDRESVVTETITFDRIHAIRGGARHLPCLFHCYGRKAGLPAA